MLMAGLLGLGSGSRMVSDHQNACSACFPVTAFSGCPSAFHGRESVTGKAPPVRGWDRNVGRLGGGLRRLEWTQERVREVSPRVNPITMTIQLLGQNPD